MMATVPLAGCAFTVKFGLVMPSTFATTKVPDKVVSSLPVALLPETMDVGSFTAFTVTFKVSVEVTPLSSVTSTVKVSVPLKSASGV